MRFFPLMLVATLLTAGCAPSGQAGAESAESAAVAPAAAPAPAAGSGAETISGPAITPENTKIEFVGTKNDGQHVGGFKQFSGRVEPAAGDQAIAKLVVDIDTQSIWSDDERLTRHLMTPDFFDVRTYPQARFVSTKIEPAADASQGTHQITGDLTLHGETRPVSFPATIKRNGDTIELQSEFQISRKEFGMSYGEGKVHDPVTIKATMAVPAM